MTLALLEKIDLRVIIANHFHTLVDDRSGEKSVPDLILFYIFPVVVGAFLTATGVRLSDGTISIISTALAIFAGLLFNLLILLHSLSWRSPHPLRQTAIKLAKQVYSNIAYVIVVSLLLLLMLVVVANLNVCSAYRLYWEAAAIIVAAHFILTICMVLKRMYVLLQDDMKHRSNFQ